MVDAYKQRDMRRGVYEYNAGIARTQGQQLVPLNQIYSLRSVV